MRNYGARNALRQMAVGDRCLLQHTGKAPAVVATLRVVRAPYAEEAQFDANGPCAPVLDAWPVQPRSAAQRVHGMRRAKAKGTWRPTPAAHIARIAHAQLTWLTAQVL